MPFFNKCDKEQNDEMLNSPQWGDRLSTYNKDIFIRDIRMSISKNKKIIAIVLAVVSIIFAYLYIKAINDKEVFYGKTKWGMTIEEVKKIEDIQPSEDNPNTFLTRMTDFDGIIGADGPVEFKFVNGKLDEVTVIIIMNDMTYEECDEIYYKISKKLTSSYGEYKSELGTFVRYTEKTKITLKKLVFNYFIIRYEDITTSN